MIQLSSKVSLRLEKSLLTPTLLFLRSLFTFTPHLLLQSVSRWTGKRRGKGLGQMSSHFRLHVFNHCLRSVWEEYFGKIPCYVNWKLLSVFKSLCCLPQQEGINRLSTSFTEEDVRSREERQVRDLGTIRSNLSLKNNFAVVLGGSVTSDCELCFLVYSIVYVKAL